MLSHGKNCSRGRTGALAETTWLDPRRRGDHTAVHVRRIPEAVAFIVRLGFAAETVDHHPDLVVNYKRVTVTYSTHSEGGLTDKDFAGADTATKTATAMGGT